MFTNQINKTRELAGYIAPHLRAEAWPVLALFVAGVLAAITEGMGITMLIPILSGDGGISAFESLPILGSFTKLFADFSMAERLTWMAWGLMIVIVLRGVLIYIVGILKVAIPIRVREQLAAQSYDHLLGVDIGFIHKTDAGLLQTYTGGLPVRASAVVSSMIIIFINVTLLAVYFTMLLMMSWQVTIVTMMFLLAIILVFRKMTVGATTRIGAQMSEAGAKFMGVSHETILGLKFIRLNCVEDWMRHNFTAAMLNVNRLALQGAKISIAVQPGFTAVAGIVACGLLIVSASILGDEISTWTGVILLFLIVLFRCLGPVSAISTSLTTIGLNTNAFTRLDAFMSEAQIERMSEGEKSFTTLQSDITLNNVGFHYTTTDGSVLRDVSFTIPKGQMIAVVGPSGAGKSTLIGLLTRLYDPTSGSIEVDGINLTGYQIKSWRRAVAVVSQDITIFNNTVLNNLRFGREEIKYDEVVRAAKMADAHNFIEALPEGYDTLLGERGVRLSGGQQQRIAIARAIATNPEVIILDEATSHLDSMTERAIQRAVDELSRTKTMVVVAHRLSTIIRADKIVVMDQGSVVEQGTHEQLLAKRGIYFNLIEHQRLDLVEDINEKT